MRVFLMGGTGLIGTRLIRRLRARGDEVVLLTRRPEVAQTLWGQECRVVEGQPMEMRVAAATYQLTAGKTLQVSV